MLDAVQPSIGAKLQIERIPLGAERTNTESRERLLSLAGSFDLKKKSENSKEERDGKEGGKTAGPGGGGRGGGQGSRAQGSCPRGRWPPPWKDPARRPPERGGRGQRLSQTTPS